MTALVVLKLSLVYRNTSLIQQPQQSFGLPCTFPFGGSVESVTAAEVGAIGGKQPECRHRGILICVAQYVHIAAITPGVGVGAVLEAPAYTCLIIDYHPA
jgi:hypothetical protein